MHQKFGYFCGKNPDYNLKTKLNTMQIKINILYVFVK